MCDQPKTKATNGLLVPNTPSGAMLAPISVAQKLNTSSATGNPRNKCALKPGYSLMGWVRLGNSGEDLAGTGGRVRPITVDELAKHNKQDDAWMAIRGKVYNVTRYMDYHPGGIDELMRGVGRDATKLFNEVHAWVNYQQLMVKCYIGPLRTVLKIDEDILESTAEPDTSSPFSVASTTTSDVVPRFDWTQKRADITFYIYPRQNCNPGLTLRRKSAKTLQLTVQTAPFTHIFEFELQHSVDWPPKDVKVAAGGTGKIDITLLKTEKELWTAYGTHTVTKSYVGIAQKEEQDAASDFEVVHNGAFNHDSFELVLQGINDAIIWLPIGYHVSVTAAVSGELLQRSYTPIPAKFLEPTTTSNTMLPFNLNFLVKRYTDGQLSSHLQKLPIGASLQLSEPRGNFKLVQLLQHRNFAFLAAGSGLTPFLRLIEHLLARNINRIEHLQLMYFNKTEADIWCREALSHLQITDERFQFINVLSQASDDWSGLRGRITKELLAPLADQNAPESVTFVAVCGPTAFNELVTEILKELSFKAENMHIFQG